MPDLVLTATGIAAGGDAIARDDDGRVVFITGAIPGEVVRAVVTERKGDFSRAVVAEVLEASPDRVAPPCPHVADGCGGCDLQHVSVPGQRRLKRSIVVDALRRITKLDEPPVLEAVHAVDAEGYRTTVRAGVGEGGVPGLRKRHSDEVVPVPGILVAHPLVAELLRDGRFIGGREVLLRASVATGQRMAVPAPRVRRAIVPPDVKVVPAHALDRSSLHVDEDVHGRRFRVSARSFFQSGPAAAELLVDAVDNALGKDLDEGGLLVDAYAGVGVLGACLADRHPGLRLESVESHPAAVADALRNLAGLDAEVLDGEVAAWRPTGRQRPAAVVADPARTGLGPTAAAALVAARPPVLVLVSCDPASLARDARLLAGSGYVLERVRVLDLFPHTSHVEAVARFVPRTPGDGAA